jgi:hypothetical protein
LGGGRKQFWGGRKILLGAQNIFGGETYLWGRNIFLGGETYFWGRKQFWRGGEIHLVTHNLVFIVHGQAGIIVYSARPGGHYSFIVPSV